MARKTDTASRILDVAQPLLQKRGFRGFSFYDLARTLGIKAPAVHYHFHTKADLGAELVARFRLRFRQWTESLETGAPSARDRLKAFFEIHVSFLKEGAVSPPGILQAEYGALPDSMQAEVRRFTAEVLEWLTATLRMGVQSGELRFPGNAEAQAVVVAATVQGAVQMARATGPETYHKAVAQLERMLARESTRAA